MTKDVRLEELERHEKEFNRFLKTTLDENCKRELYPMKIHLLDHAADDPEQIRRLDVMDASRFKRLEVHTERAFKSTSHRRSLEMVETVDAMDLRT